MSNSTGSRAVSALSPSHNGIANQKYAVERERAFAQYKSKIEQLDTVLTNYSTNIKTLDVDTVLVGEIAKLRSHLHDVLAIIEITIQPLWVDAIPSESNEPGKPSDATKSISSSSSQDGRRSDSLPTDLEALPQCLEKFNSSLDLLPGFQQIQYRIVQKVHQSLLDLKQDLQYWSVNLLQFSGSFHKNATRHHVSAIADHMSLHLDDITEALKRLLELGWHTITYYDRRGTFQDLSTTAVFFSGAASSSNDSAIGKAINFFYIVSLFLSIACAVSGQLSYRWTSAPHIKPNVRLPWWVSRWIVDIPLTLLLLSLGSYAIGSVLATYVTYVGNSKAVPLLSSIALGLWVSGSLAAWLWFLVDLTAIKRNMHTNMFKDILSAPPAHQSNFQDVPEITQSYTDDDLELREAPAVQRVLPSTSSHQGNRTVTYKSFKPDQWDQILRNLIPMAPRANRFRELVWQVVKANRQRVPEEERVRTRQRNSQERIRGLRDVVISLETQVEEWTKFHLSAVRDIKFSANGSYLATCSQDQKVVFWVVHPELKVHWSSRCGANSWPSRLSWHPKDPLLAVMLAGSAGLLIYDLSNAGPPTDSAWSATEGPVRAIAWMPGGNGLVYTEGYCVWCLNHDGEKWSEKLSVERPYLLDEVAVTPDGTRLIVIGTVESVKIGENQCKPSRSPPERRVIMVEMENRTTVFEMPTLSQVRSLDVSSSGTFLLVTYEGKVPPQLFRIHSTQLVLLQTYYLPKEDVKYTGFGQLGIPGWTSGVDGPRIDDSIVICADEGEAFPQGVFFDLPPI
ncbi:uncharacterized protein EI90DRAFT_3138396 [Cantharellus anzutake]|uniref:uncharacterized protein n=1 Tax=Cantharellus anzutake TaxID=1750568 RepID=UPI0019040E7B|nr:uncharacterized protein EI90DRAFT_3138396 [Cantharellus anzutake]KAF8311416.1 hypothetical protein EI90DRAFT_3138396 [Cantharellus anzutake]